MVKQKGVGFAQTVLHQSDVKLALTSGNGKAGLLFMDYHKSFQRDTDTLD